MAAQVSAGGAMLGLLFGRLPRTLERPHPVFGGLSGAPARKLPQTNRRYAKSPHHDWLELSLSLFMGVMYQSSWFKDHTHVEDPATFYMTV